METYGRILLIAMPAFLLLVLFEKWYGWRKGKDTVNNMDMISSLSSGVTNVTKDVLGLAVGIVSYSWLLRHFQVFSVANHWLTYVIAFVAADFQAYWVHRWNHKINILWNHHIIHHSSEEFNLACALRQSVSTFINLFTFMLLLAAVLGVPDQVVATVLPLHLFAQFWYHTRHIGRLGFLEKIMVTPSHHRVHHAINPEYLDKNLAAIFICWDKWFGTFQEEKADVPPVYGITRPAATWNPIRINFQHLWLLMKDAWRTRSWWDKLRIWVMPTGWRPADVEARYPVYKIEDVYHFEKYQPWHHPWLPAWSWVQLAATLLLISYLFGNIASIGSPDMFLYGGFVFLQVYAFTDLMDRHQYAWLWEAGKNALGMGWLLYSGDWFGLKALHPLLPALLMGYFVVATIVSAWFCRQQGSQPAATVPGSATA